MGFDEASSSVRPSAAQLSSARACEIPANRASDDRNYSRDQPKARQDEPKPSVRNQSIVGPKRAAIAGSNRSSAMPREPLMSSVAFADSSVAISAASASDQAA